MSDDLSELAERVALGIREQTRHMQTRVKGLMKVFEQRIALIDESPKSNSKVQLRDLEILVSKTTAKFDGMVMAINNCYQQFLGVQRIKRVAV